eukprot:GEMP01035912.1.p1 GENE.GEMP01035912.1~~GEMP01035912.1.p1  ORF type:complete len:510 (+),score=132.56 GEMP01035912.1:123-1652(+)
MEPAFASPQRLLVLCRQAHAGSDPKWWVQVITRAQILHAELPAFHIARLLVASTKVRSDPRFLHDCTHRLEILMRDASSSSPACTVEPQSVIVALAALHTLHFSARGFCDRACAFLASRWSRVRPTDAAKLAPLLGSLGERALIRAIPIGDLSRTDNLRVLAAYVSTSLDPPDTMFAQLEQQWKESPGHTREAIRLLSALAEHPQEKLEVLAAEQIRHVNGCSSEILFDLATVCERTAHLSTEHLATLMCTSFLARSHAIPLDMLRLLHIRAAPRVFQEVLRRVERDQLSAEGAAHYIGLASVQPDPEIEAIRSFALRRLDELPLASMPAVINALRSICPLKKLDMVVRRTIDRVVEEAGTGSQDFMGITANMTSSLLFFAAEQNIRDCGHLVAAMDRYLRVSDFTDRELIHTFHAIAFLNKKSYAPTLFPAMVPALLRFVPDLEPFLLVALLDACQYVSEPLLFSDVLNLLAKKDLDRQEIVTICTIVNTVDLPQEAAGAATVFLSKM